MTSGSLARYDYAKIKKQFTTLGKGDVRLTQSTLVLIQDINATKSAYNFPVLENDNATGIKTAEIRLNQNDEFIITELGVYLIAQYYDSAPVKATYDNTKSNYWLTHNPNYQTRNAVNCQPLYDGFLRISVNNINYVDKWDVRKHEVVQRTQWNKAGATSLNGAQMPSFEAEKDAMFTCAPTVVLSGAKKNDLTISLPNALNPYNIPMTTNNAAENVYFGVSAIAVVCRGMLAQNSASFQGTTRIKK